jgi:hypothetical protein
MNIIEGHATSCSSYQEHPIPKHDTYMAAPWGWTVAITHHLKKRKDA